MPSGLHYYDDTIPRAQRKLPPWLPEASSRYGDIMAAALLFPTGRMFYSATSMEMIWLFCLTQGHECILQTIYMVAVA